MVLIIQIVTQKKKKRKQTDKVGNASSCLNEVIFKSLKKKNKRKYNCFLFDLGTDTVVSIVPDCILLKFFHVLS